MLVINGSRDGLFDLDGVKRSFEKLEACYLKAGVKDKVRTRLHDSPHEFNAAMQAEAWQWLTKWVYRPRQCAVHCHGTRSACY